MDNASVLHETFNIYYEKAMDALKEGNLDIAQRNLYNAAESLLKLAKISEGSLKARRMERAAELIERADTIKKHIRKLKGEAVSEGDGEETVSDVEVVENDDVTLEEALDKLNGLIGLDNVKKQVNDWINQIKIFQRRRELGLEVPPMSYHLVFTGNPGTGKTTVARIIAQIYHALGITRTANFVEVSRDDLVGEYIGHTAPKTKAVLEKAEGGVLFIDEAYRLSDVGGQDFGHEAIETILKAMEDKRDDLIVIAVGYADRMEGFVSSNPGLKSRFKTFINFEDYTPDSLYRIFMKYCNDNQYIVEKSAIPKLKSTIEAIYSNRTDTFGNGRDMRNLFEDTVTKLSSRVDAETATKSDLMTIKKEDIPTVVKNSDIVDVDTLEVDDVVDLPPEENLPEPENNPTKEDFHKPKNNDDKPEKEDSPEDAVMNGSGAFENSEFKFDWNSLPDITFDDVAGLEKVKEDVEMQVLLPLKNPEAFEGYEKKNGGGLLLYGPPGTGKTMIAAAIANEIGAKFCSVKPSDLIHQGAGNTEKAVKTLFAQARTFPVAVIYFDEMDSIAQKDTRSTYAKQMRSELLAQLQGVESYGKKTGNILYLIAATNKPWEMDSAFIRPGRFGTRIYVGLPDDDARRYMIEKRLNKIRDNGVVQIDPDIDIDEVVEYTKGYNGADISNMLDKVEQFSIMRGIKENNKRIIPEDFEHALDEVRSSVQISDIEKLKEWTDKNNS